ncbi:uncharacterized protein [Drosophila bipectinata]|uniref:uncharacterized protein isoform X2 n=1 Tax=Drosophila bipectinata TaxID=42026 RepID=UPI0038B2E2B8
MRIDLKAMLLVSMSSTPEHVIRMRKRFVFGKVSYLVSYELQKGHLIIRQVKRVHTAPTLAMRIRQRRRLLKMRLKRGITSFENETQTAHSHSIAVCTEKPPQRSIAVGPSLPESNSKSTQATNSVADVATETRNKCKTVAVGTENLDRRRYSSVASDTQALRLESQEWATSQVDTFDLVLTMSREQQTINPISRSSVSQTEPQLQISWGTQVEVNSTTTTTQTRFGCFSTATQTEYCHLTDSSVQTDWDCQHVDTQTFDEEEWTSPHLDILYLIYELIKNQSDTIHDEVLTAINQLVDLTLMDNQKRRWEDAKLLERLQKCAPMDQIGDHISRTPIPSIVPQSQDQQDQSPQEATEKKPEEPFPKLEPKSKIERSGRGKRLSAWQSLYCPKRCKKCGSHMHRTRSKKAMSTDHGTQTEENIKFVAPVSDTQSEKERGR